MCRFVLAVVSAVMMSWACGAASAEEPAPAPGMSGITVGEMRIQTLPAFNYVHVPIETTFAKMGGPVKEAFEKVLGAAVHAKVMFVRFPMMIYQGGPHVHFDPDKPFKVDVGIVVPDETPAPDGVELRKTPPFKCATILYTGSVQGQGRAYQKLIPALTAAGHTPTGEEREMCLYWEGMDSVNNVYLIQVGIK